MKLAQAIKNSKFYDYNLEGCNVVIRYKLPDDFRSGLERFISINIYNYKHVHIKGQIRDALKNKFGKIGLNEKNLGIKPIQEFIEKVELEWKELKKTEMFTQTVKDNELYYLRNDLNKYILLGYTPNDFKELAQEIIDMNEIKKVHEI